MKNGKTAKISVFQKLATHTLKKKKYSFLEQLYRYTVSHKSDFQNITLKFSRTEPHILRIVTTKLKFDSIICNSFK